MRRVLDHALDHLNQIDQWLASQETGAAPTPTDGWVGSLVTLPEDHTPLSAAELDAWLWRIDLVIAMPSSRAAQLSAAQLDWTPPDGGWSLRQTLYHLARAERFSSVWLDAPLPEEPMSRYAEGSRRVRTRLTNALGVPASPGTIVVGPEGGVVTPDQVAENVLAAERRLLEA